MITSLQVTPKDDSSHVKYTVSFEGTNHIAYGEFDATATETTAAFKDATTTDSWSGFKQLVLTRLKTEATNALGGGASE